MGRIKSGKPVKDTEAASESTIFTEMTGSLINKRNKNSIRMPVSEQLQSIRQIDDFSEKKSSNKV